MMRFKNWLKWFFAEDDLINDAWYASKPEKVKEKGKAEAEVKEETPGIGIVMNRAMGYYSFRPSKKSRA